MVSDEARYERLEREHLGDPDKKTGIYAPRAEMDTKTRYFIHSRRLCTKVAGHYVNIGMREMTAEEAEPHLRAREKREQREAEQWKGCIKP